MRLTDGAPDRKAFSGEPLDRNEGDVHRFPRFQDHRSSTLYFCPILLLRRYLHTLMIVHLNNFVQGSGTEPGNEKKNEKQESNYQNLK